MGEASHYREDGASDEPDGHHADAEPPAGDRETGAESQDELSSSNRSATPGAAVLANDIAMVDGFTDSERIKKMCKRARKNKQYDCHGSQGVSSEDIAKMAKKKCCRGYQVSRWSRCSQRRRAAKAEASRQAEKDPVQAPKDMTNGDQGTEPHEAALPTSAQHGADPGESRPSSHGWRSYFAWNANGNLKTRRQGSVSSDGSLASFSRLSFFGSSRRLQPSQRIGAQTQKVFGRGAYVRNGPRVALLTAFLSTVYRIPFWLLMTLQTLTFAGFGLVYAALLMLEPSGCGPNGDRSFWRMLLLAFTHLTGGEPVTEPDAAPGCLILSAAFQYIGLLMEVVLLAVVATRFLHPDSRLVFTPVLICRHRNGEMNLLMRLGHPLGHQLHSVQIQATFAHCRTTEEGERHWLLQPVTFNHPTSIVATVTCTHIVNKESCLYDAFHKNARDKIPGIMMVYVSGYDAVLKCGVHTSYSYVLKEDVEYDAIFADVIVKGPMSAMREKGGRIIIDMQNMHSVIKLPFDRSSSASTVTSEPEGAHQAALEHVRVLQEDSFRDDVRETGGEGGPDESRHESRSATPHAIHKSDHTSPHNLSLQSSNPIEEWKRNRSLRF